MGGYGLFTETNFHIFKLSLRSIKNYFFKDIIHSFLSYSSSSFFYSDGVVGS